MTTRLEIQTLAYWRNARAARGRTFCSVQQTAVLGEIAVFGITPRLRRAATAARFTRQEAQANG